MGALPHAFACAGAAAPSVSDELNAAVSAEVAAQAATFNVQTMVSPALAALLAEAPEDEEGCARAFDDFQEVTERWEQGKRERPQPRLRSLLLPTDTLLPARARGRRPYGHKRGWCCHLSPHSLSPRLFCPDAAAVKGDRPATNEDLQLLTEAIDLYLQ